MAPLKLKFWDALEPKQKQWALLALLLGAGFTILWAIFALMYRHAYRQRDTLRLDARQQFETLAQPLGRSGKSIGHARFEIGFVIVPIHPR